MRWSGQNRRGGILRWCSRLCLCAYGLGLARACLLWYLLLWLWPLMLVGGKTGGSLLSVFCASESTDGWLTHSFCFFFCSCIFGLIDLNWRYFFYLEMWFLCILFFCQRDYWPNDRFMLGTKICGWIYCLAAAVIVIALAGRVGLVSSVRRTSLLVAVDWLVSRWCFFVSEGVCGKTDYLRWRLVW